MALPMIIDHVLNTNVESPEFDEHCARISRMVTQGLLLDYSDSERSFVHGWLWEQEEENDGASSVVSSPYEVSKWEAYLYYWGVRGPRRMGPKLIFRTSTDKFTAPLMPGQDLRPMQLLPPCRHTILGKHDLWDTISAQVVRLLDQREIKYSSVDLVRFCWIEKKEDHKGGDDSDDEGNESSDGDQGDKGNNDDEDIDIDIMVGSHEEIIITPNTIWVGVLPETLTGEVASQSSEDILALLKEHGISDVDVAYRESVVRDFKGPKLFAPVSDLNPLMTVIDPVTTALSLPIAGLKTLHNEGSMGFYFRTKDGYYAVTARHVLFPESEGNLEYKYAGHKNLKEVVLMGAQAFSDLLVSIKNRIGILGSTVESLEKKINTLTTRLQGGGSEDKEAEENLTTFQGRLASTLRAIGELKKFFREISRHWSRPKDRVIGYVIWAPPITYTTPPHNHTVDVCIIKLDKEKFPEKFQGNVLHFGLEFDETKFKELMYPRIDFPPNFEYPEGWLLKLNGIFSAEELHNANDKELNNGPATFVIKHGLATHTTIGRLSGLKSRVRRYFTPGTEDSLEVAVSPYNSRLSPFSKAGDSGSVIVDASGKFVALLTAGAGLTDASDITYGSPICWLWDLIKLRFPGANLYF